MSETGSTGSKPVVKVVYAEGGRIRSLKGEVAGMSNSFLRLKTLKQIVLINMNSIIKITGVENENLEIG